MIRTESLPGDMGRKMLPLVMSAIMIALVVAILASPFQVYAFVPPVLLLALFFLAKYPQVGYFLILFLIPLEAYRGLAEYGPLTISKLVGVWIVGVMVLARVVNRTTPIRIESNLWLPLGLFMASALVAATLSPYRGVAFDGLRQLIIAYTFFAITLVFVTTPRIMSRTVPWLVITSVVLGSTLALLGVAGVLPQFAMNVAPAVDTMRRGLGGAKDPNFFSLMVLFALPLIAHMLFFVRGPLRRVGVLALFGICVTGIVTTYSRSGALVMGIVLLLLAFEHGRRLRVRTLGILAVVAILIALLAAAATPATYWERLASTFNAKGASISARVSYLRVGWRAFQERPIMGTGLGSFGRIYSHSEYAVANVLLKTYEKARRAAHNTYVEIAVGTGAVGLVLFLAALGVGLWNYQSAIRGLQGRGDPETLSIVRAYRLAFVAVLADLLTLSRFNHKYLWLSLAISQVALRLSRQPDGGTTHEDAGSAE